MITNRLTEKKLQTDPALSKEIGDIRAELSTLIEKLSNKRQRLANKLNKCSTEEDFQAYNKAVENLNKSKEAEDISRLQIIGRLKIEELQNKFFSEYSSKKQVIESCNVFINEIEKADFDSALEQEQQRLAKITSKLTKAQAETVKSFSFINNDTPEDCYKYFSNVDDFYLLQALCKNKGIKESVLTDLLLNKVSSFYPGEQSLMKAVLNIFDGDKPEIRLKPKEETEDYFFMPTSPIVKSLFDIINNANDLDRYKERGLITSKGTSIDIKTDKKNSNRKRLIAVKGDETREIDISDIQQIASSSKTTKKLFIFILMKMNQQAFTNGYLYKDEIRFSAQELVDIGFCKTIKGAKKSFVSGAKTLGGLQVSGKTTIGKNEITQASGRTLFKGYDLPKYTNDCIIYFNERMNWNFILQYYTPFQKYIFSLNSKAFDLLFNIDYLARQNKRKIKETGEFNISMRNIQRMLNLPDEKKIKDPRGKIVNEIEKAIEEIELKNNSLDFTITPSYDINDSVSNILSGYLTIRLSGKLAEPYIKLADTQEKKIKKAADRKNKIQAEAEAKLLAEKIKNSDKTE